MSKIQLTAALIFELSSLDFPAKHAPMGTRFKGEQVPREAVGSQTETYCSPALPQLPRDNWRHEVLS